MRTYACLDWQIIANQKTPIKGFFRIKPKFNMVKS